MRARAGVIFDISLSQSYLPPSEQVIKSEMCWKQILIFFGGGVRVAGADILMSPMKAFILGKKHRTQTDENMKNVFILKKNINKHNAKYYNKYYDIYGCVFEGTVYFLFQIINRFAYYSTKNTWQLRSFFGRSSYTSWMKDKKNVMGDK